MRKRLVILLFSLCAVVSVQAQFAKPLKKKTVAQKIFCLGVTGSYAANDMVYSTVSKSVLSPFFAPSYGLVAEWNTMQRFSIGMDVSYAIRGGYETFATELLTSYSTTTFARVKYNLALNGFELRVPVTCYLGSGEHLLPYIFVAPRVNLWTGGKYRWERTYDDGGFSPVVYENEVTDAMISPVDIGAIAGVGLCGQLKPGRMRLFVKLDVGYGISLMSNFSQAEVNEEVEFVGWGNIAHEELGRRYLQNLEARLTLLVPLQKPLPDACDFDQKPYKRR